MSNTGEQYHCVKSGHIRSFSGPYFIAFRLNKERYGVAVKNAVKNVENNLFLNFMLLLRITLDILIFHLSNPVINLSHRI